MKYKHEISCLIYEFLLTRFQFGYYRRGDTLPTVESLCREFSAAPRTVLAALRRLRAEGYISMRNGCSTKVLFEQSEKERNDFSSRFFSERWEEYAGLFTCCELIITPLLAEGVCRMDQKGFEYLSQLAQQSRPEDLMLFYCYALQKLDNPLAMNLYWEASIFLGFPFMKEDANAALYDADDIQKRLISIIPLAKARDRKAAQDAFLELQRGAVKRMASVIKPYIRPVAEEERVPFSWRLYRERPQYCYSLAVHILHEIHWGGFHGLEYLPSYEKMAERYGVSVITVRRTIALLSDFGAVRSINGKGTRVCPIGQYLEGPDFSSKGVRRNLAFFIQAFEIVLYSCEGVSRAYLSSLSPDGRAALAAGLEDDLRGGRCSLSLWRLLIELASRIPTKGLQEIYGKLYGLFLWGCPLKTSDTPALDGMVRRFNIELIRSLQDGDEERFAVAVKSLMEGAFPIATQHLLRHGIQPEELRIAAPLKLFIP